MQPPEPSILKRPVDAEALINDAPHKRARVDSDTSLNTSYPAPAPTNVALLYQFAYSAWQASNRHLPQAFIPASVKSKRSTDLPLLRIQDPTRPVCTIEYRPDPLATARAIELSLLALDALATLLKLPNLSDKERVTAGLLFGKIGLQIIQAQRVAAGTVNGILLDHGRLLEDIHAQLAISVSLLVMTLAR
jgi:hypothetical protein